MRRVFSLSIFFTFVFLLGCGIKGYPEQPFSNKPSPVKDLKAKQQGSRVVFFWRFDKTYEDGRPISEPFEFYGISFDKKEKKLKVKNYKDIYWFEERIKHTKKTYCYRIFIKTKKKKSEISDIKCILIKGNYQPPLDLKLIPEEAGIRLRWSMKTNINIYRAYTKDVPPVVYRQVKNGTQFLDIDVKTNNSFCYYITVPIDRYTEGEKSKTVCIRYTDIFPPLPPSDGFIYEDKDYAIVFWEDSPSKDVKGYRIYKNGKRILDFVIKTYYFKDKNYKKGDIYYITAVDNAGNESKPLIIR